MHNLDDTHPIRPGYGSTSSFEPQLELMSHRGRPILYCQQLLLTVYILTTLTYFVFLNFSVRFLMRRESVIRNNSSIDGSSSSHYQLTNLNSLGHGICVHQENILVATGTRARHPRALSQPRYQ